ncbi:hypothetical protein [Bradyrhizobium sp. S69]|uniref:hypothetical protein n=1 Tax=Bradyrhizobium sp. S69 TaxID=1641856 RepID=UPI00131B193A|nr:hypothetical protein [Bradyrhizobium sp. S69]
MELFGQDFTFKADDDNADRLIAAMQASEKKHRDIRDARTVLQDAGCDSALLYRATDPVTVTKVSSMSVEYAKDSIAKLRPTHFSVGAGHDPEVRVR